MRLDFFNLKLFCLYNIVWITLADGRSFDLPSTIKDIYTKGLSKSTLPFEDCGSRFDLLYVNVSSCSTIPCQMIRGSTIMVKVIFNDYGDQLLFLKHRVRWILNAIKTDAFITPDPCDDNHHCIVDELDGKSYDANLYVNTTLPNIRGTIMWTAENQDNEEVICFKFPIYLTDESN